MLWYMSCSPTYIVIFMLHFYERINDDDDDDDDNEFIRIDLC